MDALHLLQLQLELECKRVDTEGLLYPVPCDNPDDLSCVFVARHAAGWTIYFRHDLPLSLRQRLKTLPAEQLWADVETVQTLLAAERIESARHIWRGSTYHFAQLPSPAETPDVIAHEGAFVMMQAGEPVAWAWSSRTNARAAELAVETKPAFRRRGFARQVAAAWARSQLQRQKVAFYSHLHDNLPSRALATSLGVVHIMDVVGYG